MKLSRVEEVSILLIGTLAQDRLKVMPLSKIAKDHGVSPVFLKKISRALRKHGLLKSKEGSSGGYMLAKDPVQIRIIEILNAANTGKSEYDLLDNVYHDCPLLPTCLPALVRATVLSALSKSLSDITLDQVIHPAAYE